MEGHSQNVSTLGGRGNAGLVRTYVDLLRSFLFYIRSIIVFQHVRSQDFGILLMDMHFFTDKIFEHEYKPFQGNYIYDK